MLLQRFLEDELARRYRDAAPATLGVLQMKCDAIQEELKAAEGKLKEAEDVASLRRAGLGAAPHVVAARQVLTCLMCCLQG
jgi:hypothetical protein